MTEFSGRQNDDHVFFYYTINFKSVTISFFYYVEIILHILLSIIIAWMLFSFFLSRFHVYIISVLFSQASIVCRHTYFNNFKFNHFSESFGSSFYELSTTKPSLFLYVIIKYVLWWLDIHTCIALNGCDHISNTVVVLYSVSFTTHFTSNNCTTITST